MDFDPESLFLDHPVRDPVTTIKVVAVLNTSRMTYYTANSVNEGLRYGFYNEGHSELWKKLQTSLGGAPGGRRRPNFG